MPGGGVRVPGAGTWVLVAAGWVPAASRSSGSPRCKCNLGDSSAGGPRSRQPGGGDRRGGEAGLNGAPRWPRHPSMQVFGGPRVLGTILNPPTSCVPCPPSPAHAQQQPQGQLDPDPKVPTEPPWRGGYVCVCAVMEMGVSTSLSPPQPCLSPKGHTPSPTLPQSPPFYPQNLVP